jgi:hypothetical protein
MWSQLWKELVDVVDLMEAADLPWWWWHHRGRVVLLWKEMALGPRVPKEEEG